jgi:hypothetical protein
MGAHGVCDFFCEVRPTLEPMTVARDELALMACHMRQRAEAVKLHLVQPVGMVEWLRDPEQTHWSEVMH